MKYTLILLLLLPTALRGDDLLSMSGEWLYFAPPEQNYQTGYRLTAKCNPPFLLPDAVVKLTNFDADTSRFWATEALLSPFGIDLLGLNLQFLIGLKYANQSASTLNALGAGPQVGLEGSFNFYKCFSIAAGAHAAELASRASNTTAKNHWHAITNYDGNLGLKYSPKKLLKCMQLNFESGYEYQSYPRFLLTENDEWSPFILNGPYVKATLSY